MLKKIVLILFLLLNFSHISNAFKVQMPEIVRDERFLPIKTDLPLKVISMRAKAFHKNIYKNVLLITPENWDHFERLLVEYESNPEEWVSPFLTNNCREIIFLTTMLDLTKMHLTPDHIAFLPKLLPHLQALSLREYCAHNEVIMAIAKIETLEEIDLWQNHATKEGIKELALLPNLKNLNLGFNDIHQTSLMFEKIKKINNYIQSLEKDLLALTQNLVPLSNIEKMRKKVLNEEIEQLKQSAIEALSKNNTLQKLNLTGTELTKEDLKIIATMDKLTQLNLTANDLQNHGAEIISEMSHLKSLHVTGNKIKDVGIDAFYQMKNLKKLNISRNHFSDVGETKLSKMYWLKTLNVSESDFITNNFANIRNMPETIVIGLDDQED